MRPPFKLFRSHLDLAHSYWERLITKGDHVIDATCGNGHDTLVLAKLALDEDKGRLWAMDIQQEAFDEAQRHLQTSLFPAIYRRIQWKLGCHSVFPESISPHSIQLIVYNLGYLPRGDKTFITQTDTTLKSVAAALSLLQAGGALSITCYPGHPGGEEEQQQLLRFFSTLAPSEWSVCHHQWVNRLRAPSLILVQKANIPAQ